MEITLSLVRRRDLERKRERKTAAGDVERKEIQSDRQIKVENP